MTRSGQATHLRISGSLTAACCFLLCLSCSFPSPAVALPNTASSLRVTRAPYVQLTSSDSIYLVWNTNIACAGWVRCQRRVIPPPATVDLIETTAVLRHVGHLTNLQPSSRYTYWCGSGSSIFATGVFQTNKLRGQAFRIAVWGDSGTASLEQKKLERQMESWNPDLLLHTGDLIYPGGEADRFNPHFFDIYAALLARIPFYGCLGNHDIVTAGGKPFVDSFVLPLNGPPDLEAGHNYSIDYADVHVAVIDSNLPETALQNQVAPWLTRDLEGSSALWKFVVFHHPPFSSGIHGPNPKIQRTLVPLFVACHVDLVLNGHDHDYERFKPQDGVRYLVTGAGGAPLYNRDHNFPETDRYMNQDWSFTCLDISGKSLRGRQITAAGAIVDDWSVTK